MGAACYNFGLQRVSQPLYGPHAVYGSHTDEEMVATVTLETSRSHGCSGSNCLSKRISAKKCRARYSRSCLRVISYRASLILHPGDSHSSYSTSLSLSGLDVWCHHINASSNACRPRAFAAFAVRRHFILFLGEKRYNPTSILSSLTSIFSLYLCLRRIFRPIFHAICIVPRQPSATHLHGMRETALKVTN